MSNKTELEPCYTCKANGNDLKILKSCDIVMCRKCGTRSTLDMWNNRPIEDALREEIEDHKDLIECLEEQVRILLDLSPNEIHPTCETCGNTNCMKKIHWSEIRGKGRRSASKPMDEILNYCSAHTALKEKG